MAVLTATLSSWKRFGHFDTTDEDGIDLLVVEGNHPGNLADLESRGTIRPHDVFECLAAYLHAVVVGESLVRAPAGRVARTKQFHASVRYGHVVAYRLTRLHQDHCTIRLGHSLSVKHDFDVPAGRYGVYAQERVARVNKHLFLLFEPGVHLSPVERHISLQEFRALNRCPVGPHRIFGHAVADLDRPE